jgi:hypothetical protein
MAPEEKDRPVMKIRKSVHDGASRSDKGKGARIERIQGGADNDTFRKDSQDAPPKKKGKQRPR